MKYLLVLFVLFSCKCFAQDSSIIVYDDGGEFKVTKTTGLVLKYCDTAYHGLQSMSIGAWQNSKFIYFTTDSALDASDYDTLKFYIKLKKPLGGSTGNIRVALMSGDVEVSNVITLDARYGLRKADTGFQKIEIPIDSIAYFPLYPTLFNKLRISLAGIGDGLYMDYVQLHESSIDLDVTYPLEDTIDTDTAVIKVVKPFNPRIPFGRFDTTRVLMTVIDTAQYYGSFFSLDGQYYRDTIIQSPQVIFMFGYKVTFEAVPISFMLNSSRYNATINLIPKAAYLDEFKHPLRRGLIVIPKNIIDIKQ